MVFVDDERGIVVREQLVDEAPMFYHMVVNDHAAIDPFLNRIDFPSHAVVSAAISPVKIASSHLRAFAPRTSSRQL